MKLHIKKRLQFMKVSQSRKLPALIKWCATLIISLGFVAEAISADMVKINFRDADIRSVIESVAEITGESFVLDPRVKGKVTIISPESIDKSLLYEAILSAIQVQGYQAIRDGAVTRIVPFNQSFNFAGGGKSVLVTEILKVRYVQAATLIPVLKPLMSNGARVQAYNQSNYLVVSDIRSNVDRLKMLLSELDDPDQTAVEVITLEHISAAEAVHIAGQLKQLQKQDLSLVEDDLNNRVIVSGPGSARTAFRDMLESLDVPLSKKGSVEVIYLNYSRASELKPVVDGLLTSEILLRLAGETTSKGKKGGAKAAYKVEIDELNNALILAAPAAVIREIKNIVGKLDISRPQVLIEAVIAQLSEDQAKSLGADLVYTSKDKGGYLTNFDGLLSSLVGTAVNGTPDAATLTTIIGSVPASSVAVGGNFDPLTGKGMGLLIQALQSDDDTNILSTPSVVTLDNEEATLTSGEEVPFQTGSYTNNSSGSTSSNPFTTYNREEVGILLKVKPQISKGNAIRLEIEQESSKVKSGSAGLQTTSKNTIKTNVMIDDGQLLVLGGLIEDTFSESEAKVPLLGDIPLLGRLFKRASKTENKQVTMMFIRPTIIRNPVDAKDLSDSKFEHLISRDLDGKKQSKLSDRLNEILQEGHPQETE
ncbi:type II secretion system secretin GspD [Porticoccaceae bacterium]|jgi:general secretion pathway protein D|nr:type II secretion system secretin GspD [Porticoccaceae bacterium]MDA9014787.1 type II secretion system secretin GspD [Porticoccaceae bacterium]